MLYLDYQATSPLAPEARLAMLPWLDGPGDGDGFANPAGNYRSGRAAAAAVEVARDSVARLLPDGGQVYFTSGATEAINWALRSGSDHYRGGVAGLAIEHAATIQCLDRMNGTVLPVDTDGVAVPPDVGAFGSGTIAACMLVNNEVGTIQPVADFADAVHQAGGLLLCDAVQAAGRVDIPPGPDFIALSAHKIHGPKGIGALWVKDGVHLPPFLWGGAQEQGMRAGTVSPALCAGFGAAAALADEQRQADTAHVETLWTLATEILAGWTINGSVEARYRGNLNIRRDGVNAVRLLSDARSVAFSLGSACGSGSGKVSHVLRAMGLSEAEARSSIRLGWGRYTSETELRDALTTLLAAAKLQGVG